MSPSRIDVFISSTSIDLPQHRAAVRDAILSLGFFPSGMETWPVSGDDPVTLCQSMVEDAEIYIGIYAHRYGWRPDGFDGKSITELEYDWAGEQGMPRFCFVMKDDYPWPKTKMEVEAEADLQRFKTRVKANQVGFFGSPEDLKAQVIGALANYKATHTPDEPIQWEAGATFDKYTLRELLGTGGNGQVWLADERLPDNSTRPVAIKVLREGISENPTRVTRFKREISSMARIDYPHIVPVFTYGDRADQLYVIMPYLRGGTLREQLTGEPLSLDRALTWLEQVGAALDHVHDRYSGLIHRDVKPENMLLSEDEMSLYLADFGLVFSADDDEGLTEEGTLAGTGRYMAPEQWRGDDLSRQTDLYALGILAYELLTGHLPYQEANDYLLAQAHCERDLPADTHLPDEILRILRKATAERLNERYPTARAFLTDLRNWDVDPANLEPRIRDYLNWVTDELYESVRAQFVELQGDEIALRPRPATPRVRTWDDDDDLFARASASVQADHVPADDERREVVHNVRERLLSLDRAVLVGEPGSGKSWMLRRLQADYARAWLKDTSAGRGLIPVLVRLNEYDGGSFEALVKAALDTLAPYHDALLRDGRLVLLCDALNEMPRTDGQMAELLAYLEDVPYFVVSCRVRDYDDDLDPLKPLEQVLLRDLGLPAIRELVTKRLPDGLGAQLWKEIGGSADLMTFWQAISEKDDQEIFWDVKAYAPSYTTYAARNAWREIHRGARLIPLCRNPYMGDLLCRTYRTSGGHLPDSRARLFEQFIAQMLSREARAAERRGETFPPVQHIETALVDLARALQDAGRTVLDRDRAIQTVLTDDAEGLLGAATNANILSAEADALKFAHQLLQEYFAARILLEKMEADEQDEQHGRASQLFGETWWEAGVWRETTVILGEFLGEGARGANRAARWLAPVSPEVALQIVTRNGAGLTLADVDETTRERLVTGARDKTAESRPLGRAAAYRVLGTLNADDRAGVGVSADGLPDVEWVYIPDDGEWTYQDETHSGLGGFEISKYPITYAQFQAFLDAPDGYGSDTHDWFAGLAADANDRQMREQAFQYKNHPRESVNWYQAMAFCRWWSWKLSGIFYALDDIDRWDVRLPTEYEWEKAARGMDGRTYPYDNDFDATKSNTSETGIGKTSAVGIFPAGASPYGVLDMSGNVWEWCLTEYNDPKQEPGAEDLTTSAARVLRGGSWSYGPSIRTYARAASRTRYNPDYGPSYYGFRVCRPPSR